MPLCSCAMTDLVAFMFQTPLHAAALDNKHSFISLLIDYGANTDLKDTDGNTPYVLAEKNKNEGCCILLVERIGEQNFEEFNFNLMIKLVVFAASFHYQNKTYMHLWFQWISINLFYLLCWYSLHKIPYLGEWDTINF